MTSGQQLQELLLEQPLAASMDVMRQQAVSHSQQEPRRSCQCGIPFQASTGSIAVHLANACRVVFKMVCRSSDAAAPRVPLRAQQLPSNCMQCCSRSICSCRRQTAGGAAALHCRSGAASKHSSCWHIRCQVQQVTWCLWRSRPFLQACTQTPGFQQLLYMQHKRAALQQCQLCTVRFYVMVRSSCASDSG